MVGRVGDGQAAVVGEAVGEEVVEHAAVLAAQQRVLRAAGARPCATSLESRCCRKLGRLRPARLDLAHVRDVEDARTRRAPPGARSLTALVLDRHLPAGEGHEPRAGRDVAVVQRACGAGPSAGRRTSALARYQRLAFLPAALVGLGQPAALGFMEGSMSARSLALALACALSLTGGCDRPRHPRQRPSDDRLAELRPSRRASTAPRSTCRATTASPTAPTLVARGHPPARARPGAPDRLAVRQLRRPRRRRRSTIAGHRRRPLRRAQRALRHRRLRPARRRRRASRRSTARSTRRREGIYSQPFADAENLERRRAARRRTTATSSAARASTRGDPPATSRRPTSRATWTRCATRSATPSSTTSASPTARSSARRTRACSRAATARSCSTARSTPTSTSTARCESLREQTRGLRARARIASSRPARPTRTRARASAATTRARRFDELVDARARHADPGGRRTDPRPVDGDDLLAAAAQAIYAKQLWPVLARGLADGAGRRRHASCACSPTSSTAATRTAPTTRAPTATSRSARDEQRYPTAVDTFLDGRRRTRGGCSTTSWWNSGYVELNCGRCTRSRARDVFTGPFTVDARRRRSLVVGTTYDPATPYRGAQAPGRPARQRPAADHARRRAHGLRRQLAVHRHRGRAPTSITHLVPGRRHDLPPGRAVRAAHAGRAGASAAAQPDAARPPRQPYVIRRAR